VVRPWIKYTIARLAIFAIALAILLTTRMNPFLATVIAAIVGLALSYIFFRKLRGDVASEFAARNEKPEVVRNVDTEAEDDALDNPK
jgi:L-lactate permease